MIDRNFPSISPHSILSLIRYFLRSVAGFIPPSSLKSFVYKLSGISIQDKVFIGPNVYFIDGFKSGLIEIKREAVISNGSIVVAMAVPGDSFLAREYKVCKTGKIVIEEGAWIGVGAVLLPGVKVGRGAIVGSNAVVSHDVPALEVWGGVPAKFIKKVEDYGKTESLR